MTVEEQRLQTSQTFSKAVFGAISRRPSLGREDRPSGERGSSLERGGRPVSSGRLFGPYNGPSAVSSDRLVSTAALDVSTSDRLLGAVFSTCLHAFGPRNRATLDSTGQRSGGALHGGLLMPGRDFGSTAPSPALQHRRPLWSRRCPDGRPRQLSEKRRLHPGNRKRRVALERVCSGQEMSRLRDPLQQGPREEKQATCPSRRPSGRLSRFGRRRDGASELGHRLERRLQPSKPSSEPPQEPPNRTAKKGREPIHGPLGRLFCRRTQHCVAKRIALLGAAQGRARFRKYRFVSSFKEPSLKGHGAPHGAGEPPTLTLTPTPTLDGTVGPPFGPQVTNALSVERLFRRPVECTFGGPSNGPFGGPSSASPLVRRQTRGCDKHPQKTGQGAIQSIVGGSLVEEDRFWGRLRGPSLLPFWGR
ncbi:hypothetical protein M885DRAFT_184738 [Pelagophyceae sp. CCMP2097]|nr:hypothetical protein M885DRAFT_184738 [Pelagophyceae sp. CCMP2097]|mmetsp:Transcript_14404/g.48176  ORF Transcript_14404/g.48176 Transcript_14404/m.48176 type:complete len:419 (-) Transcript_14404:62-1318(-)